MSKAAFLWAAAATAAVTFAVHTFVGGVYVARPLLADQSLPRAAKWLAYYCWHIATLTIVALALAFGYEAIAGRAGVLTIFGSGLCLAFSALSALVALRGRIMPLRFPSTSLFALTSALGWAALSA
jgi:hypothetical protein